MIAMNKKVLRIIAASCTILFFMLSLSAQSQSATAPLRLAVSGLSHGHVPWILGRKDKPDVILVGIYEPDTALANMYAKRYTLDKKLFYTDLNKMLDEVKPEAV